MPEINLLPQELKPKGYAIKLSKTFRKVATIGLVIFFVFFLLFVAASIFLSYQTRNLKAKEVALKNEIVAHEQTEQKLVLVADRLQKISEIKSSDDAKQEVGIIQSVMGKNPQNIIIEEVTLTRDSAKLKISTDRSSNLTKFFTMIYTLGFKKINLLSFDYSAALGYRVEISITI